MGSAWDAVIVGQGLAGSTLAWQLHWRGQRVLVVDEAAAVTSSKIAAGLITPITGQRLVPSWRLRECWAAAHTFYNKIVLECGQTVFHPKAALRIFSSEIEKSRWQAKTELPMEFLPRGKNSPESLPEGFSAPWGGFEMQTAQLNVPAFLSLTEQFFTPRGQYRKTRLDAQSLIFSSGEVHLPLPEPIRAKRIIFCQGYQTEPNPFFAWVPFKAARGDILTLSIPSLSEQRNLHGPAWLTADLSGPAGQYKLGATYDWEHLSQSPSPTGRAELEQKLRQWCHLPYTVLGHTAAVRPIIRESKGLLGTHPSRPELAYFNGLGSKGSLHAPLLSGMLADHLVYGAPLEPELDLRSNS
jgi:glycine/D-amino acid oxidase-like deaminating enzyme